MGLPLMSLLMAVGISQAAASEDEEAQENPENPMDGRTTGAHFQAQQTREEEEAPLERLPKSRPIVFLAPLVASPPPGILPFRFPLACFPLVDAQVDELWLAGQFSGPGRRFSAPEGAIGAFWLRCDRTCCQASVPLSGGGRGEHDEG